MSDRPVDKQRVLAAWRAQERPPEAVRRLAAHDGSGKPARASRQISPQGIGRHQAAVEQRFKAGTQAALTQLCKDQCDIVIVSGNEPADSQRLIQRFFNQPWNLGVVGQLEPGIDVRLER
jgi:hypothetical protein